MAKKKKKKDMSKKSTKGAKQQVKNVNFFAGVRDEMKQVTWPSRQEAIQLTVTVIIISLIVALYVGIIDLSLAKVLEILSQ